MQGMHFLWDKQQWHILVPLLFVPGHDPVPVHGKLPWVGYGRLGPAVGPPRPAVASSQLLGALLATRAWL